MKSSRRSATVTEPKQKLSAEQAQEVLTPLQSLLPLPGLEGERYKTGLAGLKAADLTSAKEKTSISPFADVIKANEIINARFSLKINAHRLVAMYTALISPEEEYLPLLRIPVGLIAETFSGLSRNERRIKDLRDAAAELFESSIRIESKGKWIGMHWAPTCMVLGSDLYIRLNQDLRPWLLGLYRRGNFTRYKLHYLAELTTPYQYRLYELFSSAAYLGRLDRRVEELREMLDIPKDEYNRLGHFNSRILQPSLLAINKHTDLNVQVLKGTFLGKRQTGWIFQITRKQPEELPFTIEQNQVVERLVADGFSTPEARILAGTYAADYLIEKLDWAEEEFAESRIGNLTAFLRKAISEDYQAPAKQSTRKAELQNEKRVKASVREEAAKATEDAKRRVIEMRDAAAHGWRIEQLRSILERLSQEELMQLRRDFAATLSLNGDSTVLVDALKGGQDNALLMSKWRVYLFKRYSIPEPDRLELQTYMQRDLNNLPDVSEFILPAAVRFPDAA